MAIDFAHKSVIHKAVQIALLTTYDMCKAVDHGMVITGVRPPEKQGGQSAPSPTELSSRAAPCGRVRLHIA